MARGDKGRRARILIVEDEWDILEVLKLMLEDEGHSVVTAKRGRDALAAANAKPFDLVLMDISMPDMDGIEVAKALRASDKTKNVRIAIHTGLDEKWVHDRLPDYDLFLTKAADTDVLVRKIALLLAADRNAPLDGSTSLADAASDPLVPAPSTAPGSPAADPTFSVDEALQAKRALLAAVGLGAEPLVAIDFVHLLRDEIAQLRRRGMPSDDVAALVGRSIGRPFSPTMLESDLPA